VGVCALILAGCGGGKQAPAARAVAAASGGPAPACTVSHALSASTPQTAGLLVSPTPGLLDASAQSQISLLGAPASSLRVLSVVGSSSGSHPGHLRAYTGAQGASFVPDQPFTAGERVQVSAQVNGAGGARPVAFAFTVAKPAPVSKPPSPGEPAGIAGESQTFHSRADLNPPAITVSASSAATPGDVFIAPLDGPGQDGPMIFDSTGTVVWFKPLPRGTVGMDFREQQYRGSPVLTWWQGYVSPVGIGFGEDEIYDSTYNHIATVRGGNGYQADLHEFTLTSQGSALITAYAPVRCDLSSQHGPKQGTVLDSVVQEVDVSTGLVMYEWHSLGSVMPAESYTTPPKAGVPWDYFHINSIDDDGGQMLLSARNTWAVYALDMHSGTIAWRLGGKRSDFQMGPGTRTAWQHDARMLPDGSISIFDDEASPANASQSRGVVLNVNVAARTVSLAHQYQHPGPLLSGSQGNMQVLGNGHAFVGWGALPNLSEFDASGHVVFDATLPAPDESYRAYRSSWTAHPATRPAVATVAGQQGAQSVYASWNGATEVASWRVLGGTTKSALNPVSIAPRSGFETQIDLGVGQAYLAVQALDAAGNVLATSATLKA
jgi:hypothetical protein